MKKKSIKTIEELENYIFSNFQATLSDVDEVNTYENYNLEGDNEHDYTKLVKVYKILGEYHPGNDYEEVFILIFSKNGGIYDAKILGMLSKRLEKMWRYVVWEE